MKQQQQHQREESVGQVQRWSIWQIQLIISLVKIPRQQAVITKTTRINRALPELQQIRSYEKKTTTNSNNNSNNSIKWMWMQSVSYKTSELAISIANEEGKRKTQKAKPKQSIGVRWNEMEIHRYRKHAHTHTLTTTLTGTHTGALTHYPSWKIGQPRHLVWKILSLSALCSDMAALFQLC